MRTAFLGPAGSWTHQAALDLFGEAGLVPLAREELFAAYTVGTVERACLPVTTSIVGMTPYMDAVLDLPDVMVIAEYPRMLGYSLLVRPGTRQQDITEVFAHPVALEEAKPWLDRVMPHVRRTEALSGGDAAQRVALSSTRDKASVGPRIGASIYRLVSLLDGIEEGPHNVTRWWVLGRAMPAPTGRDKTSMLACVRDEDLAGLLAAFSGAGAQVLTIYERPSRESLDTHRYLIEVAGHARDAGLMRLLEQRSNVRLLGSYPRAY
jgi:chorismate mutase/prephenate dehydratase